MRSLFVILLQRGWQGAGGVVTLLVLIRCLSVEGQGWYYSFLSLAAVYTIFDLGLSVVLSQQVAHQFVGLTWQAKGLLTGNAHQVQALQGFVRWAARRYCLLASLYWLVLCPLGMVFFYMRESTESHLWMAPWVLLITSTAVSMLFIPFMAIVEGSGRVFEVYSLRLIQGVAGSLTCWAALLSGGGLWAAAMPATLGAVIAAAWLLGRRPHMLRMCMGTVRPADLERRVWSLQWRTGLTWLSGYLLTQVYTPILFHFEGEKAAGQLGLSLTIANMLGLMAQSWLARSLPAMAAAAAQQRWMQLNRLFRRDFMYSLVTYFAGMCVCLVLTAMIQGTSYADRLLEPAVFFALMLICLAGHVVGAMAAHLRSHLSEPLVWGAVMGAGISVPVAVWAAAVEGTATMVNSLLMVQAVVILPLTIAIWWRSLKALQG